MKPMLISSVNKPSTWYKLIILSWLAATTGCTKSASRKDQEDDMRSVIKESFSNKWVARFINNPGSKPFVFRYEELPIHNGYTLPKPTFDIILNNKKVIKYTINNREESDTIPILIEQVIVNHDSAIVNLRVPMQWLSGRFRLGRTASGKWVVMKDYVAQE